MFVREEYCVREERVLPVTWERGKLKIAQTVHKRAVFANKYARPALQADNKKRGEKK